MEKCHQFLKTLCYEEVGNEVWLVTPFHKMFMSADSGYCCYNMLYSVVMVHVHFASVPRNLNHILNGFSQVSSNPDRTIACRKGINIQYRQKANLKGTLRKNATYL